MLSRFSCFQLCATLWTASHQVALSTGFSRQEYWSGLPFPSPMHEPPPPPDRNPDPRLQGIFPTQGSNSGLQHCRWDSLPVEPQEKPKYAGVGSLSLLQQIFQTHHFSLSCNGEGNGNPLQCSGLKNPRDAGALWAAVSGVAQSQTRLKRLSSSSTSKGHIGWRG